ncbi:GNAT family N-acetyltransferase [Streptomyces prunicolor]|uniref:GNAT family N-acetyltransferase n=1 Tax=Streptomyces prunicolor TaxID=67348 RepID=UPI0003690567|nr:GNAT family N-acetyltransferase [Streptomyces prunicolor]
MRTLTSPATPDDIQDANALHARCSLETRFARYGAARRTLSRAEWEHLTNPDRGITWATRPAGDPAEADVVALTHLMHTEDEGVHELALLVDDSWQGQGLGSALARNVLAVARTTSVRELTLLVGSDNRRMQSILRRLGAVLPPARGTTVNIVVPVGT